jgi:hypothetical protein
LFLITFCRTNITSTIVIIIRWQHNFQMDPPTAVGQIPPLSRICRETRVSLMGMQDMRRALKQQANTRLTVPHVVTTTDQRPHQHQKHRARRAIGKPTDFIPRNLASSETAPAGRQQALLLASDSLTIHLVNFSNSTTDIGIGIPRSHNTAGTRTAWTRAVDP